MGEDDGEAPHIRHFANSPMGPRLPEGNIQNSTSSRDKIAKYRSKKSHSGESGSDSDFIVDIQELNYQEKIQAYIPLWQRSSEERKLQKEKDVWLKFVKLWDKNRARRLFWTIVNKFFYKISWSQTVQNKIQERFEFHLDRIYEQYCANNALFRQRFPECSLFVDYVNDDKTRRDQLADVINDLIRQKFNEQDGNNALNLNLMKTLKDNLHHNHHRMIVYVGGTVLSGLLTFVVITMISFSLPSLLISLPLSFVIVFIAAATYKPLQERVWQGRRNQAHDLIQKKLDDVELIQSCIKKINQKAEKLLPKQVLQREQNQTVREFTVEQENSLDTLFANFLDERYLQKMLQKNNQSEYEASSSSGYRSAIEQEQGRKKGRKSTKKNRFADMEPVGSHSVAKQKRKKKKFTKSELADMARLHYVRIKEFGRPVAATKFYDHAGIDNWLTASEKESSKAFKYDSRNHGNRLLPGNFSKISSIKHEHSHSEFHSLHPHPLAHAEHHSAAHTLNQNRAAHLTAKHSYKHSDLDSGVELMSGSDLDNQHRKKLIGTKTDRSSSSKFAEAEKMKKTPNMAI